MLTAPEFWCNSDRLLLFSFPIADARVCSSFNHSSNPGGVMYRHGDILVAPVPEIPGEARPLQHLVLAEGELTGHAHRISERDAAVLFEAPEGLFLRVTAEHAILTHQEHGPISLPRGEYRVWRQREYSPQSIRVIRD